MTSMECKQIFAQLSQYLDRELPDDICEEIGKHIQQCPPCVEFLNSLKKTVALCRQLKENDQPAPLPAQILDQLLEAYRKFHQQCKA